MENSTNGKASTPVIVDPQDDEPDAELSTPTVEPVTQEQVTKASNTATKIPFQVRLKKWAREHKVIAGVLVVVIFLVLRFMFRSTFGNSSSPSSTSTTQQINNGVSLTEIPTTTSPWAKADVSPLQNLPALTPTAQWIVGNDYDNQVRFAQAANKVIAINGNDVCAVFTGVVAFNAQGYPIFTVKSTRDLQTPIGPFFGCNYDDPVRLAAQPPVAPTTATTGAT